MTSPFDLTGKVALVTGGNGGIGLAIAEGLGQAGCAVAIAGRNPGKNAAALAALTAQGIRAAASIADVVEEAECRRLVGETLDRFGRLDILVNNAGTNIRKQPQDYSAAEFRLLIDINLTSTFMMATAAYPAMRDAGGGKIINIGSMTSLFGASFAAPYGASKGGVVQLTKALASAWARDGIQVNAILPGWIDTDLTRQGDGITPELRERIQARTPAGRWGQPGDLAGAAVFLASADSDFVTGTAIPVDGGYSAQG
ncbi:MULTISPECIES: glucose 1-dehydrogenase [Rhodomicrobium]|uniref:SDR family NAD(P)-dependent oxidoreductase n=1 Tax=Rhodomicrobium TaxID=1068 RepID=UPI000B4A750D|nr:MULTISPECIES: glucose 1-dehydrogenase [Rhodomicrobium]